MLPCVVLCCVVLGGRSFGEVLSGLSFSLAFILSLVELTYLTCFLNYESENSRANVSLNVGCSRRKRTRSLNYQNWKTDASGLS